MKPETIITPCPGDLCDAEWISTRHEIIVRDGINVRAGADNSIELSFGKREGQLAEHDRLKINPWVRMTLPNSGTEFDSADARDRVLQALKGETA